LIEVAKTGATRRTAGNHRPERYEASTVIDLNVSMPADDVRVVHADGEIDMLTAPVLDSMISSQLSSRPRRLVLDLQEIGFMSSAGIASLMSARSQALRAGVDLRIVCANEPVLRPLTVTGLFGLFNVYPELRAALR